jgi:hypothetical protein
MDTVWRRPPTAAHTNVGVQPANASVPDTATGRYVVATVTAAMGACSLARSIPATITPTMAAPSD